jgi:molecular chaperone GrpE
MIRIDTMGDEEARVGEDLTKELQDNAGGNQEEGDAGEDKKAADLHLEKLTKSQLIETIREIQKESEKNYDLYLRSQAELENIKKRFKKEKEGLIKFANDSLIKQLLPVVDNLEKALAHSEGNVSVDAVREGVELTIKELMSTLKNAGVEAVMAVGQPFDPNFHEAMFEKEDDSVEPGTVLEELQRGYLLNQRLLRPAMVSISKLKSSN